jgi:hypothetical protein
MEREVRSDTGLRRIILALIAAAASFFVVGAAVFYKVDDVKDVGWRFGGPVALSSEMAGLFGGGLAAVVVLIAVLRWRRGGRV